MSTSNQVPEHFEVQVVGAAVLDSFKNPTRLLIAQRSAPPILAGLWEFPGGRSRRQRAASRLWRVS